MVKEMDLIEKGNAIIENLNTEIDSKSKPNSIVQLIQSQ